MAPSDAAAAMPPADVRRDIARRVALAHEPLLPGALAAMVFGSTVDGMADGRSDLDMGIVFDELPAEDELRAACQSAGGAAWSWHNGNLREEGMAVGFDFEGIEVQIAYTSPVILQRDLDELLVDHKPDTLNHKVAEGLLKAEPLIAPERLAAWRAQVARYPQGLADAMMRHHLAEPTPWKWFGYLLQRDSALWCRELLVDACYRLFGLLAGLNHRYYTHFQFKRMHRFAGELRHAPPDLADRVEALLVAPLPEAFRALYALDGEVLALLAVHAPHIDCGAAHDRRTRFNVPPA